LAGKRWRIDFTVREADVPAEEARGISFGDEVSASDVYGFFNRCRDAVVTLVSGERPKSENDNIEETKKKLVAEFVRQKTNAQATWRRKHYQPDQPDLVDSNNSDVWPIPARGK
jgi:hypothetical protein